MTDRHLEELRAAWRTQDLPARSGPVKMPRGRFLPHLAFVAEVAVCGGTLAVGLWFLERWDQTRAPIYAYASPALIAGSCAILAALFHGRRGSFAWRDESPRDLILTGVRRAEAHLRVIRIGRWHIAAIAAFVGLLWLVEWAGALRARSFLELYTATCMAFGLAGWLWLSHDERAARQRLLVYRRLLEEYEDGDAAEQS